jgi:hypothetical protein
MIGHQVSVNRQGNAVLRKRFRAPALGLAIIVYAAGGMTAPALATSGWGCFRVVNVLSGDVLNLRATPDSKSAVVDRLAPDKHGILAEAGPCKPINVKPSRQWCPLTHYNGDHTTKGWARLVFLAPSQCP